MTDRERLIELMQKRFAELIKDGDWSFGEMVANVADYLLANGVIVQPTRCKDCTYLRESDKTNRIFCTYHGDGYEFETQPNDYCSNGVGVVKGA